MVSGNPGAIQIDADTVLERLAAECEADLADLFDPAGELKPIHQWPLIWRQGLVTGLETEEVGKGKPGLGLIRKLKLSDRVRRLEMLGKHTKIGAFTEKHEHNMQVVPVLNVTVSEE